MIRRLTQAVACLIDTRCAQMADELEQVRDDYVEAKVQHIKDIAALLEARKERDAARAELASWMNQRIQQ